MTDSGAFLVKLLTMNWVERRFQRESAIANRAESLWVDFATAIKDSVDSYNTKYKPESKIEYTPNHQRLRISKLLRSNVTPPRLSLSATIECTLEVGRPTAIGVVRSKPKPGATPQTRKWSFLIEADDDGLVFLKTSDGAALSTDEAAQQILEEFLFQWD